MLKVIIADDEPKIRKGLRNILDWKELDMEVVGEAEDGEIALELIKQHQPDILLVDICMPFINGLELIDKTKEILHDCNIIVVTGHDEFTYAQQALKLKVYDYILKPVSKEQFLSVITKARDELSQTRQKSKYLDWAKLQLKKNLPFLKETFLNDWINGHLTHLEIEEQKKFLEIKLDKNMGMIVIKVLERINLGESMNEWDRHLLLFAVQNIVEELLNEWQPNIIFRDNKENIIAIINTQHSNAWVGLSLKIENTVEKFLKQVILTCQCKINEETQSISLTYEKLINEISDKGTYSPIVMLSQKYIDANYYKENLSLQDLAEEVHLSPNYLSRLLKQEIGFSFIDYLTKVRTQKAIQFLNNPKIKMYEVAEKVGYSNQHYFSTAFKKVLGVSPAEYRKGGA